MSHSKLDDFKKHRRHSQSSQNTDSSEEETILHQEPPVAPEIPKVDEQNLDQNEMSSDKNQESEVIEEMDMEEDLADRQSSDGQEGEVDEYLAGLEVKVRTLEMEVTNWQQKTARIADEMQRLPKQHELDLQTAKKSAKKHLAGALGEFLNTLNLAFNYTPQTDDEKVIKFVDTLKGSFSKLQNDLTAQGVEVIVPEEGEPFNAETMNVLNGEGLDPGEHPAIKHVVSVGIKLDGQVIRPAMVMV